MTKAAIGNYIDDDVNSPPRRNGIHEDFKHTQCHHKTRFQPFIELLNACSREGKKTTLIVFFPVTESLPIVEII